MNDQDSVNDTNAPSATAPARKLLLGKRTVRHFAVRTNIQTGNTSTGANCTASASSVATPPSGGFNVTKSGVRC